MNFVYWCLVSLVLSNSFIAGMENGIQETYILRATNKTTQQIVLSSQLQSLLSNTVFKKSKNEASQQHRIKCSSLSIKQGLQLIAGVLTVLPSDDSDTQIKKLLRGQNLEAIQQVNQQCTDWQIPLEGISPGCNDADVLVAQAPKWTIDKVVTGITFSKDNSVVAFGTDTGACWLYTIDGKSGQEIASRDPQAMCESINMTSDKQTVALSYPDELLVWRKATTNVETIPFGQSFNTSLCSLKTTPQGTLLMLQADYGISLYLVGNVVSTFLYNDTLDRPIKFSRSGEFIYTPDPIDHSNFLMLNSKDGSTYAVAKDGNAADVVAIGTSRDGKYIVTGDNAGGLGIYDYKGMLITREPKAHDKKIWAITTAHNEHYLFATGSFDGTIKLWNFDPATQRISLVSTIESNMHQICRLKFTIDDFWLFSWDTDSNNQSSTRIWDRAGNNVYTWNNCASFQLSSDSSYLAIVHSDKGADVFYMHMLKELSALPPLLRLRLLDTIALVKDEAQKGTMNLNKSAPMRALQELVRYLQKSCHKVAAISEIVYKDN